MSAKGMSRPGQPPGPLSRARAERPGPAGGASLLIEDEGGQRTLVPLARDSFSIGRDSGCDLCLPQLNISRRHALLERGAGGAWVLRDLGSRYGSFVNGRRVEGSASVSRHDIVQIGDFLLTLARGGGAAADERDPRALDLPPKETVEPLHDRPDRVRVFGSLVTTPREVRLDCGPVLVGAGEDCTVRTPELPFAPRLVIRPLVSRYGDRDSTLDGGRRPPVGPRYEIIDESSAPCLLVNSRPLKNKVLDDDDIVELADHREVDDEYAYRAQRTFALRYLRRGRASLTHLTPPPLREDWTPPSLPVDLPPGRVEHRWAEVGKAEPAPRPGAPPRTNVKNVHLRDTLPEAESLEALIEASLREANFEPSPRAPLPSDVDDTVPPARGSDTVPTVAPVRADNNEVPTVRPAPPVPNGPPALPARLAPPSPPPSPAPRPVAPPLGPAAARGDAARGSGEIHRLLSSIVPDGPAPAPARAVPAATPSPRLPIEIVVGDPEPFAPKEPKGPPSIRAARAAAKGASDEATAAPPLPPLPLAGPPSLLPDPPPPASAPLPPLPLASRPAGAPRSPLPLASAEDAPLPPLPLASAASAPLSLGSLPLAGVPNAPPSAAPASTPPPSGLPKSRPGLASLPLTAPSSTARWPSGGPPPVEKGAEAKTAASAAAAPASDRGAVAVSQAPGARDEAANAAEGGPRRKRTLPVAASIVGVTLGIAFAAFARWGAHGPAASAAGPAASMSSSVAALTSAPVAAEPRRTVERPPAVANVTPPLAPPERAPAAERPAPAGDPAAAAKPRVSAAPKPRPAPAAARPAPGNEPSDAELQRHLRCQKLGICNEP